MKSLIVIFLVMLGACGKVDPPAPKPPVPPAKMNFTVNGAAIEIQGTVKVGAKTNVDLAEAAVKTAVNILERN